MPDRNGSDIRITQLVHIYSVAAEQDRGGAVPAPKACVRYFGAPDDPVGGGDMVAVF